MSYDVSRTIIETLVRKAVADIRDTPKRSTRNLVDMALNFAEGRFQSRFLQIAQTMLKNENSAYYKLIPDIVANADTDKIVTFGMNLGYNSCTVGAKKIRMLEEQEHFNIPWSLTLAISGEKYASKKANYHSILEQGKSLGVYTWMIYALDEVEHILDLAEEHPECAFVFFCTPNKITNAVLDEAVNRENVMFAVLHTDGIENACHLLRTRKFLYSVFHVYGESDLEDILNGNLISDTETLHPAFTAFLAEPDCAEYAQKEVYQYVTKGRTGQNCQTVLWDVIHDDRFIDGIISDDVCSAGFDPDGNLCVFQDRLKKMEYNIFRDPLADILKMVFPKTGFLIAKAHHQTPHIMC